MKKKAAKASRQKQELFARTIDTVLNHAGTLIGSNIGGYIAAIYDAVRLLDQTVTPRQVDKYAHAFPKIAESIFKLGDMLISHSFNPLRFTLTNIALNYQMLAIESLERGGKSDEAAALFRTAYLYARKLAEWNEKFPPEERILGQLSWGDHAAPGLLCNVGRTRTRLLSFHAESQAKLDKIERNIDSAEFILRECDSVIRTCEHLFEFELGDSIVRYRPGTPYAIRTAKSWVVAGKAYLEAINTEIGDDATINRTARARIVALLVEAQVKSAVALAYVEFYKTGKAYANFEVLGHQAIAYGEAANDDNWDFYAAPAFARTEEPLFQETLEDVLMLVRFADAALAYALCLEAQMRTQPRRLQPPVPEPQRVPKTEKAEPIKPADLPQVDGWILKLNSQEEIRSEYHSSVGFDKRENWWLGIDRRTRVYPKQRLVGFNRARAGRTHRRKKKTA